MSRVPALVVAALSTIGTLAAVPYPGDPPFRLMAVSTRVARPGQQGPIEEYYRRLREAEARLNVDGLTDVYVVVQGGRAQTFMTLRAMNHWHELDNDGSEHSHDTLARDVGAEEARRLGLAMAQASESLTTEVLRVTPGMSRWHSAPSGRAWPYIQVRRTVVKPGMARQYGEVASVIREARARASAAPELRWQVAEGPGNVHGTMRFFRGWQDRDLWEEELAVVLGDEAAARWYDRFQAAIVSSDTFVLRHRQDLSRSPKAKGPSQD